MEPEHLSFRCRIYRTNYGPDHEPCSGGCDKSHGTEELCEEPCECECHE